MKRKIRKIISENEIKKIVKKLGEEVSKDYADKNPILVGILKGSFIFLADLVRRIKVPHEIDFISVASYGSETQASGMVRLLKDLSVNIEGRDVIIVEDVVDSGLTLNYIKENLLLRKPKSLEILTLLDKKVTRKVDIPIRYIGFSIPNEFVIGYGLDLNEDYRYLPYLAKFKSKSKRRG
jgi:hypoxanthine phosphoribosyltransferase